MPDLANIGFSADTSALKQAKSDMEALSPAAGKVEQSAEAVAGAMDQASAATARATTILDTEKVALNGVSTASNQTTSAVRMFAAANSNAAATATQLTNVSRGLQGQVGNISAQFSDIAVQLAGGQSPFQIALQQGTQLSQVFAGQGLTAVIRGLGSAFLSVISPVSLLTVGIIALAGYAYQYFTAVEDGGAKSEETLSKQAALVSSVAEKWGEIYPALKAYNDELQRNKDLAELATAQEMAKADAMSNSQKNANDMAVATAEVVSQLRELGESETVIMAFQNNMEGAKNKTLEGKSATDELSTAVGVLEGSINNNIPAIKQMITWLKAWQTQAASTAVAVAAVMNGASVQERSTDKVKPTDSGWMENGTWKTSGQINLPKSSFNPQSRPLAELEGYIGERILKTVTALEKYRNMQTQTDIQNLTSGQIGKSDLADLNFRLPKSSFNPQSRPLLELEGLGVGSNKGGRSAKNANGAEEAKSALEGLNDNYKELLTSFNQAQTAYSTLDNALKAGVITNDEYTKSLETVHQAFIAGGGTAEQWANVIASNSKKVKGAIDDIKSDTKSFATDIAHDLESGKSFFESFTNAIGNLSKRLIDRGLNALIDKFFEVGDAAKVAGASNTAGSGIFGGIAKFIGGLFNAKGNAFGSSGVVKKFANGGSFTNQVVDRATAFTYGNGKLGVMGEKGDEAVVPLKRGPDGSLGIEAHGGRREQGGNKNSVEISNHYELSGAISADQILAQIKQSSEAQKEEIKKSMMQWLNQYQEDGAFS